MGNHRRRQAFATLELLIALAALVLIVQLCGRALDVRTWSKTTWFVANLLLVMILLGIRATPHLRQSWEESEPRRRALPMALAALLVANVAIWPLGWSKLGQWGNPFLYELAKFEELLPESAHVIEACPQPPEPIELKLTLLTDAGPLESYQGQAVENFYGSHNGMPERMSRSMKYTNRVTKIHEEPWRVDVEIRRLTESKFGVRDNEARWVPSFGSRDSFAFNAQNQTVPDSDWGSDTFLYFAQFPKEPKRIGESWTFKKKVPKKTFQLIRQDPPHCTCTLRKKVLFDQREAALIECVGRQYMIEDKKPHPVEATARFYVDLQTGLTLWQESVWRWSGKTDRWRDALVLDSIQWTDSKDVQL